MSPARTGSSTRSTRVSSPTWGRLSRTLIGRRRSAVRASDERDADLPDLPLDASTVFYVPNMRPNKVWRDLGPQAGPLGRSDYWG